MENTLKVLHIVGSLNIGGIQKLIINMSNSKVFNELNRDILCTISNRGSMYDQYILNKFNINFLPFRIKPCNFLPFRIDKFFREFLSYFYFIQLIRFFISSNYNIIHSHIHIYLISQVLASIMSGKKIIWTIHGEYKINYLKLFSIIISST